MDVRIYAHGDLGVQVRGFSARPGQSSELHPFNHQENTTVPSISMQSGSNNKQKDGRKTRRVCVCPGS